MTDRKALIAKLRKLLALSRSANEHEAALALEKAAQLMDQLGLSEADAALIDVEEAAARGSRTQRPAAWECLLAGTVRRALGCELFIDEDREWRFVGRGATAEVASYAFKVLYRHLKRARQAYIATALKRCGPTRKRQRADAFCEGWAVAVYTKVKRLRPESPRDELVRQYLAERHPGLTTADTRRADARKTDDDYFRGARQGSSVELAHGLGTAAPALLEAA